MHGLVVLVVLALIGLVGYRISLHLHPFGRSCRKCKGTGEQHGLIFRYSWRPCLRCGGNSDRARIGLRTVLRNSPTWGERAAASAKNRRASRNFGR